MKRNVNLEKIIKKLDISDTMKANAEEKYMVLAKELNESGIKVHIYPQGSFALGTVVRPYTNGKDVEFDLDFICEEIGDKNNKDPKEVKKCILDVLKKHGRNVDEDNTCWIIEYADVGQDLGFKIDVVPAVKEDRDTKNELIINNVKGEYAEEAIAITKTEDYKNYSWDAGNAKGYTKWFNDINLPFLETAIINRSNEYKCSVEELPEIDKKSSLQRVIQILKRHRDIHFYRNQKKKPSSAIITTLVAEISKECNPNIDIIGLLQYVIENLQKSTSYLYSEVDENINTFLKKKDGKWNNPNPVNPSNNLASDWDDDYVKVFLSWIDVLKEDLLIRTDDERYYSAMKNAFGAEFIESNLDEFDFIKRQKMNEISETTKPWKN